MASKYAGVIDKLPKMLNTEPAYQEKVVLKKTELLAENDMLPWTSAALADEYIHLRSEEDHLEDEASTVRLRRVAIEQMLADQLEAEGNSSIVRASGFSVSVQLEPYASVVDRDALRKWAIDNGLERSLALPWQTVNSLTKTRLLEGEPEPDGVQATSRTKMVLRKKA